MNVSLIAAFAEDRLLGSEKGHLPWDLPRDKMHFRRYTAGKWLLLGRKTYEEMEGWFTDQRPLILTRSADFRPSAAHHAVVSSVPQAIDLASGNGAGELVVCGGAGTFAAALPYADTLVLTRVKTRIEVEKPVFFPEFESSHRWRCEFAQDWSADAENHFSMRFEKWHRRN
ncbi:MAG: dihydrofolate reductase [Verrucomicrobiales bacterium]|jgi:dihydrofolate reductase|nr:dihydrofolate reductase [Verrucomicrobiales bacterium]HQZ27875.1 dihydrofolate reductase [Verrucomicrobiales bacterium]